MAYTDPEVAWVGVTEGEAKAGGIKYGVGKFPYAASGRAIGIGRTEGFTKLIFDEATHRVIGAGIVGPNAGDLISEVALAIEMGCEAADIGLTVHPHPTLSRIGRHGGRSIRRYDYRSVHSEEEVMPAAPRQLPDAGSRRHGSLADWRHSRRRAASFARALTVQRSSAPFMKRASALGAGRRRFT